MSKIATNARKVIGLALAASGAVFAILGLSMMVTIIGIIPGAMLLVMGMFLLSGGLDFGWPEQAKAWQLKKDAEKVLREQAAEKEAQKILAEKAGE